MFSYKNTFLWVIYVPATLAITQLRYFFNTNDLDFMKILINRNFYSYSSHVSFCKFILTCLQTPTTLAQLLQNVPGYSYTPGESIFTDIFMTLVRLIMRVFS
jgi:hypothetical protein